MVAKEGAFDKFVFDVVAALIVLEKTGIEIKSKFAKALTIGELKLVIGLLPQVVVTTGKSSPHIGNGIGSFFGFDVDRAPNAVGIHIWRHYFGYFNELDLIGGDDVHTYVAHAALGRGHLFTVDVEVGEFGWSAAQLYKTPFALVALKGNAGDALHDFGGIHIGESGNLLGGDNVFDVFSFFLLDHGTNLAFGFALNLYFGQGN